MKYVKHEDCRGYFAELARAKDLTHPINQVSIFTINPTKSRGDHYHRELDETFIVLDGKCEVFSWLGKDGKVVSKTLTEGDSVSFCPLVQHKFFSLEGCKILVLSSKEYDSKNPDVYKY